jgi:hypothetical protein
MTHLAAKTRETRPDSTSTIWVWSTCTAFCGWSNSFYQIVQTNLQYNIAPSAMVALQGAGATVGVLRGVTPHQNAGKRRELYLDPKQRKTLHKAATGAVRDLIEAVM